jgi:hypothetical protein
VSRRYVLDDLAVVAGLGEHGTEHHRREFARLLVGAVDGGLAVACPAICLAIAGQTRPAIVAHLAQLVATCPADAITLPGLTRTGTLDAIRDMYPHLDWPAVHAVTTALSRASLLVTTDPTRYDGIPLDVIDL